MAAKPKITVVVLGSNCFSGSYMVDELLANPDYFVDRKSVV